MLEALEVVEPVGDKGRLAVKVYGSEVSLRVLVGSVRVVVCND